MRRSGSVALPSALTLAAALAVLTPGGSQAATSASAASNGPDDRAADSTRARLGLSADARLIPKYVEFFANNSSDNGDYRIGEKIVKVNPHFLRRMDNPRLDAPLYNNGDHSYNCWSPTIGNDDVHFSSGPANHWFYLLAEGSGPKTINGIPHNSPSCNRSSVSGIGRTPAARIWYRAVDIYMTSTSQYSDARDATIRAARDLFGVGSTRCQRVVQSWNAVSVAPNNWSCAPIRTGSRVA